MLDLCQFHVGEAGREVFEITRSQPFSQISKLACPNFTEIDFRANDTMIWPVDPIKIEPIESGWMEFLTRYDRIYDTLAVAQISSYKGYNDFQAHLDEVSEYATAVLFSNSSDVWLRIMMNEKVNTSEAHTLLDDLNEGVRNATNNTLRYIEEKKNITLDLYNYLSNLNFTADVSKYVHEMTRCESSAARQLLRLFRDLNNETNLIYYEGEKNMTEIIMLPK